MTGNRRLRVAFGRTLVWLGGGRRRHPRVTDRGGGARGLVSSSPAAGATIGAAPDAVVLKFDEPLAPSLSHAAVVDPTGRRFTATVSGERMRVPLGATVPGVYHVTWTTVSEVDGHTITGEFQFGVGVAVSSGTTGGVRGAGIGDVVVAVLRGVEYIMSDPGLWTGDAAPRWRPGRSRSGTRPGRSRSRCSSAPWRSWRRRRTWRPSGRRCRRSSTIWRSAAPVSLG